MRTNNSVFCRSNKPLFRCIGFFCVSVILCLSCFLSDLHAQDLKKASFAPQWIPQAQFAGYMVALDKGFYKEAGIDLTLLVGGPGNPPLDAIQTGKATFCTDWLSNGIEKRSWAIDVVNLAQISQRSALVLVAKKKSGIEAPQDLNGKNVGLWAGQFYLQPRLFFQKYGISVNVIPNYSSVSLFLKGGVDAMSAMYYNEYHTLINSGLNPEDLTIFFFDRHGLSFPEDGIYCMESTFLHDPDMCAAFVRASLKGWFYAFDHQDEAVEIVMKHARAAHTGTNRAHQRWMLARMKELIIPDGDKASIGKLKFLDYELVGNVLKDSGDIRDLPKFDEFYRGPK